MMSDAVGLQPLGHVDDIEQRLVEHDHDVGVLDVVVDLDRLVADARERLDGRTHPLRTVLRHGLHVLVRRQSGLGDDLRRRDGSLTGARMPTDLRQLLHSRPSLHSAPGGAGDGAAPSGRQVTQEYGRPPRSPLCGVLAAVNGAHESVNGDQMLEIAPLKRSAPCLTVRRRRTDSCARRRAATSRGGLERSAERDFVGVLEVRRRPAGRSRCA